jgi:hypothetical protein
VTNGRRACVAVVGSLNADHRVNVARIPVPGETVLASPVVVAAGGKGANQATAGIGVIHATLTGTQGASFAELFNTSTRTSGASIGYQVAASIAGFAPFLAVLLANSFGWMGPALFYVAVGLVGLAGVLATKETWGSKQRAEVDALISGQTTARTVEAAPS